MEEEQELKNKHPGCIRVGWSGVICLTDDGYIVKHPKLFPDREQHNDQSLELISIEREIYERLGDHDGIIKYLGVADPETGAIKLAYARQGDLDAYIQHQEPPPESLRISWIQSLVETFHYIYSRRVLHQDVKLENIVVDEDCLKVIDFAKGALFALDADMDAECAADPESRVDILRLGCVMYSIATWFIVDYDYYARQQWPTSEDLPSTDGVLAGPIIQKCWQNEYSTLASLYEDFRVWLERN